MRNFADVFRLPPPNLQPCDVKELVESVAFLFKAECARRRIDLRFEIEDDPRFAQMDRSQMEQVFVNVLKNAMEAIGEDGRITIRVGEQANKSFVVIEDTGCGVSPAAQANLFTPFFSTKGDGQGIGLTITQEILDAHGFEFSLESKPGNPTQFTIWF
jgi:signal transduction histidine kinase